MDGRVEAVVEALQCIGNKEACVKVTLPGVGNISESNISQVQVAQGRSAFHVVCGRGS